MRRNISDPSFDFATFMPRFGDASPWLFTTSAFAWLAPCAALALASVADAAAQNVQSTVYKCTQANGLASYQDFPCKGGVVVDIKPDVADPAAIKRLERAQEAFNRGAALRQAQEIEALRREQLTRQRHEIDAQQEPAPFYGADPGLMYGSPYAFYEPYVRSRPDHSRFRDHAAQRRTLPDRRVPAVIHRPHPG